MVNVRDAEGQEAPGGLEAVRTLLNSWLIPNDSRAPTDLFAELATRRRWSRREAAVVRELRGDLRQAVEAGDADVVNTWVERLGLRPVVADGAIAYRHGSGAAGDLIAAVLTAIGAGTWPRLKACPDCRWVFYDTTRNGSKRWCLMYAGGPDGRACGTIAKVRRYRQRQAGAASADG